MKNLIKPVYIQANELRHRNLIQKDGKVWAVNDIYGSSGLVTVLPGEGLETLGCRSIHDFDPIPLTPEWLERFGFEQENHLYWKKRIAIGFLLTGPRYGYFYRSIMGHDEASIEITSVHQLQNLYFAIAGEELTTNP